MSLLQGILINPPRELRVICSLCRVLGYYLRHILVTEEEEEKEAFQSHYNPLIGQIDGRTEVQLTLDHQSQHWTILTGGEGEGG